jgi:hypothetical protein
MGEQKERPVVTAAVIVLVFMLVGYIIYTILVSPESIFSSNTTSLPGLTITSNTSQITPVYSVLGSTAGYNETVSLGSFFLSTSTYNTTIFNKNVSLSVSIFGGSGYNIPLNESQSAYYLEIIPTSVYGSPKLSIYLNGQLLTQSILVKNQSINYKFTVPSPGTLTLQLNLNGLALSQSATLKVYLISNRINRTVFKQSISLPVVPRLGEFGVQFIPIGNSTIQIIANNETVYNGTFISNKEYNVSFPTDLQLILLNNANAHINLMFLSSGNVGISNAMLYYYTPLQNVTISGRYNITYSNSGYQMDIQILKVYRPGNITIVFPQGEITIPSSEVSAQTVFAIPSKFLGMAINGYVSGSYRITSNGLYLVGQIGLI